MKHFLRKYLVLMGLLVTSLGLKAQIDPTAPQMLAETVRQTTILTQVMTGIDFLEKHADKIEKAIRAVESIEVLGSLSEVYQLINAIACMSKDLNILVQQTAARDDCLLNFKFQYPVMNLNAVGDLLNLALEAESMISKKDRVDAINEAGIKVKQAGQDIAVLTQELAQEYYGKEYIKNRVAKRSRLMFMRRQF